MGNDNNNIEFHLCNVVDNMHALRRLEKNKEVLETINDIDTIYNRKQYSILDKKNLIIIYLIALLNFYNEKDREKYNIVNQCYINLIR